MGNLVNDVVDPFWTMVLILAVGLAIYALVLMAVLALWRRTRSRVHRSDQPLDDAARERDERSQRVFHLALAIGSFLAGGVLGGMLVLQLT